MEKSRKLLAIALSALCCVLLVLCVVFAAGWSKASKIKADSPEVRSNGTAIQWKYASESEWHDLVSLDELKGAAGEKGADGKDGTDGKDGLDGKDGTNGKDGQNGADGKNGVDGKDGADGKDGKNGRNGVDGKSVEVKKTDSYIQWRREGGQWQNLVALSDITGPSGQKGADGKDGKSPEFRVNENTLQWRYAGDEVWLNLYDLSSLRGSDGKTPFIGENGNWWIGETDTGVKAAGADGIKGDKGDQGEKGEKGDKGDKGDTGAQGEKGDAGQNGACSGYFYAEARIPRAFLNDGGAALGVYEKVNSGDLISAYLDKITLKKGHVYSVTVSGSLQVVSNEFNNSGNYSIQMTDGYDDDLCREVTRIKRDGEKIAQTNDQHSFNFTRIYNASDEDITLYFMFEQSAYNTRLESFRGTITITALN